MSLPSNILKNIKEEAKQYQHIQIKGMVDFSDLSADNIRYAYEDGATAYAEHAQKMAVALKEFISMHETGLLPNRFTYLKGKEALAEWEKEGMV